MNKTVKDIAAAHKPDMKFAEGVTSTILMIGDVKNKKRLVIEVMHDMQQFQIRASEQPWGCESPNRDHLKTYMDINELKKAFPHYFEE